MLLDKGADLNARTKETPPIRRQMLRVTGYARVGGLHRPDAVSARRAVGRIAVMRLLLEHGADPNIPTFGGTTALMAAAGVNWVVDQTYDEGPKALLEAVKLCYELGIDVNAVNSMGLTALHGAANRGSDDIIEFLVEQGAKLDVKDKEGRTPLTWAEGVFLATHPRGAEAEHDRAAQEADGAKPVPAMKLRVHDALLPLRRDVGPSCSPTGVAASARSRAAPPRRRRLRRAGARSTQYCVTCHNARAEDRRPGARRAGRRPRRRRRRDVGEGRPEDATGHDAAERRAAARSAPRSTRFAAELEARLDQRAPPRRRTRTRRRCIG